MGVFMANFSSRLYIGEVPAQVFAYNSLGRPLEARSSNIRN